MVGLAISAISVFAVIALLGVSALFRRSEIALCSLPGSWLDQQAASGDRRAVVLRELVADPRRVLVARPSQFVERVLSPLITLFDGITRQIGALLSVDDAIEKVSD